MLKPKIKRMAQQGYRVQTIMKKLGASESHVRETLRCNKKKCKIPQRISDEEWKLIKRLRKKS